MSLNNDSSGLNFHFSSSKNGSMGLKNDLLGLNFHSLDLNNGSISLNSQFLSSKNESLNLNYPAKKGRGGFALIFQLQLPGPIRMLVPFPMNELTPMVTPVVLYTSMCFSVPVMLAFEIVTADEL